MGLTTKFMTRNEEINAQDEKYPTIACSCSKQHWVYTYMLFFVTCCIMGIALDGHFDVRLDHKFCQWLDQSFVDAAGDDHHDPKGVKQVRRHPSRNEHLSTNGAGRWRCGRVLGQQIGIQSVAFQRTTGGVWGSHTGTHHTSSGYKLRGRRNGYSFLLHLRTDDNRRLYLLLLVYIIPLT